MKIHFTNDEHPVNIWLFDPLVCQFFSKDIFVLVHRIFWWFYLLYLSFFYLFFKTRYVSTSFLMILTLSLSVNLLFCFHNDFIIFSASGCPHANRNKARAMETSLSMSQGRILTNYLTLVLSHVIAASKLPYSCCLTAFKIVLYPRLIIYLQLMIIHQWNSN